MVFDFRDGRLKAGDELLMINGHSLVGLSHQEAVAVLRSTAGLVQLVVASRVSLSLRVNQLHTKSIIVCHCIGKCLHAQMMNSSCCGPCIKYVSHSST